MALPEWPNLEISECLKSVKDITGDSNNKYYSWNKCKNKYESKKIVGLEKKVLTIVCD